MNALPEEELRRRQAHAPELLRVPDDFECNFCNHGVTLRIPLGHFEFYADLTSVTSQPKAGFRVADHTVIHSATSDEHCTQAQKL
jgi:hypothetical protein